jgi:hypothetical protein
VLVDREADCAVEGVLRCFVPVPDADECVSVADVKYVVMDAEDDTDDPPEDRDEEDEATSKSISSSSLTASGVEKSANDFCANLQAEERFASRCSRKTYGERVRAHAMTTDGVLAARGAVCG